MCNDKIWFSFYYQVSCTRIVSMGNDGVAQVLREYQVKLELHMEKLTFW
jgi:hypothetical protein